MDPQSNNPDDSQVSAAPAGSPAGSPATRSGAPAASSSGSASAPAPSATTPPSGATARQPTFEEYPLTRPEYINAMVHFYRGEMYRSQVWRQRLDTTTNWAVVTVAAMTSFAFSDPSHSHLTLLLANLVILAFLSFEARRFRYFSVYRARVRMIEENFYMPLIRRTLVSPKGDWGEHVADDLDIPKFKSTFFEAIGLRMWRNYLWIYSIVFVTWLFKLFMHPEPVTEWSEIYDRLAVGPIGAPMIIGFLLIFYGTIIAAMLSTVRQKLPSDEVRGIEREMDHWKV